VEVRTDGDIVVRSGSTAARQGHSTTWSNIIARNFDVDPERVVVIAGDTTELPTGWGSYGSRSTQFGGSAIHICSLHLIAKIRHFLADRLEARSEDVEVRDGVALVKGDPTTTMDLGEIAAIFQNEGQQLAAEYEFVSGSQTFPFGACVAAV